jgi:hypothetical protein
MTTSDQEEQAERRRVLQNDARLRDQSRNGDTGTYLSHTHIDDAGGRFAAVNAATIVGQDSQVKYPPLPSNSPWHGSDPVPDEPLLGCRIDAMPESENPGGVLVTDDPAVAPSGGSSAALYGGLVSEPAGSSSSSDEQSND